MTDTGALPASPDPAPRRQATWFGVIGLLLLTTLLAAAFVQVRQYALLSQATQTQDDYLAINLYQFEVEYYRLREQWRLDLADPAQRHGTLQLRYDIFISRVALLRTERAARLLQESAVAPQLLHDLDAFTTRADLYLGSDPRAALSREAAQALLEPLVALGEPIHQLLIDATHRVAQQMTERQATLHQHNQAGLLLTGFLSAMALLFAAIALRQMRSLEQRRRHLEALAEQLRSSRIEAENASAAKSVFLADMSHELRTPLHGLLGMLSLLRATPRDVRAGQWLQAADDSAAHLMRLIDDLLDLSKLESGTLSLQPRALHLSQLLREAQALMQPAADAKGLQLEIHLSAELPGYVRLDPTRTRQVLYNLLNNAIKFSEAGTVTLRCRRASGSDGQALLEFEVSDTGIGMDSITVSRLFQRFARSDDPQARRQAGAGLGLAISRNLARLMGGELRVQSTPGSGSAFSFRCPLLPAADPAPAPAQQQTPLTARPLRILVAEDHPVNRMYLGALLDRLGHQGHPVENGLEAVQAAREQSFDLVLMDVHMPVMDGVAATAAIRAGPEPGSRVQIVALTADVFADTRERCLRAGIDEVITKPVSLQALTEVFARRCGAAPDWPAAPAASDARASAGMLLDHGALASVRDVMGAQGLQSLYAGFFEQAADAARRLREAMRDADTEALRRAAHAVKGAALNLGFPALAEAASQLSREPKSLSAPQIALAVQRFEETVNATRTLCVAEGLIGD